MSVLKDFREFLTKQNALALAIGVIIGGAVGKVVTSITSDLLMPVIGLLIPGGAWRDLQWVLSTKPDGTPANAIHYGQFMGTLLDFVIVATVVFFITKMLIRAPAPAPAAPTKTCPECLETIPAAARRCRACGSAV
jgi:large conductance mechanosensitive channel